MGITGMWFYFLFNIQASFFRHMGFRRFKISKKVFFFKFRFQASQKNVQVWSLYTHFRGVFLIKNTKRMCICEYVKNRIGIIKNVFLGLKKGISRLLSQIAAKTYCFSITLNNCYEIVENFELKLQFNRPRVFFLKQATKRPENV